MRLYTAARAPNPRRVDMFLAEKGVGDIERVLTDLNAGEHREAGFLARNPLATLPVLELDDGRCLAESRAICSFLETLYPEPNRHGTAGIFDSWTPVQVMDRRDGYAQVVAESGEGGWIDLRTLMEPA